MLNEVAPEKCVEIILYLRRSVILLSFGSDLLRGIEMAIYNCTAFQNLPSSQPDPACSAETRVYTPSPLKSGRKHFS